MPTPPDRVHSSLQEAENERGKNLRAVRAQELGVVLVGDPGFVLARRPDTVRYCSLLAPRLLSSEDELGGEDVVPGFRTGVASLFEP